MSTLGSKHRVLYYTFNVSRNSDSISSCGLDNKDSEKCLILQNGLKTLIMVKKTTHE